jgi:hypothetical protein
VLPGAMKLLANDPDAHVRATAIEVVGQFVHSNQSQRPSTRRAQSNLAY